MTKKRQAKIEPTQEKPLIAENEAVATTVRDRIQALLNELTDAELNILIYEIENPQERRSMEKLGRIASARLKRPKAIKELTEHADRLQHRTASQVGDALLDGQVPFAGVFLRLLHLTTIQSEETRSESAACADRGRAETDP